MLEVFSMISEVAPTENTILILGESGTGKELTAKAIHELSQRKDRTFTVINCAEIPEALLETALFGYEKGAFRGSLTSGKGKLEVGNGGTVYIEEIGEMPLSLQGKLLRVIEEGVMERLGGKRSMRVDVRVIASSSRSLEEGVKEKRFRLELYHRINRFTITLPSLNDRGEDKIILAKYYLKRFCLAEGISKQFSRNAIDAINSYSWPGNVQELINKIRRSIIVCVGEKITPADLSLKGESIKNLSSLKETKALVEKQRLIEILETTSYNISKASVLLGVSRPTVYTLIKKYRIDLVNK
jgi:DNA-binding NtrC family response regulator